MDYWSLLECNCQYNEQRYVCFACSDKVSSLAESKIYVSLGCFNILIAPLKYSSGDC